MGTKAVFSIFSQEDEQKIWSKVIGMTHDGFIHELINIAKDFNNIASNDSDGRSFSDPKFITAIINEIVKKNNGWLFVDNRKNPKWVAYSAIFNPFTGVLKIYQDYEMKRIKTVKLKAVDLKANALATHDKDQQYHIPFTETMRRFINLAQKT